MLVYQSHFYLVYLVHLPLYMWFCAIHTIFIIGNMISKQLVQQVRSKQGIPRKTTLAGLWEREEGVDFDIETKDWLQEQKHIKLNLDDGARSLSLLLEDAVCDHFIFCNKLKDLKTHRPEFSKTGCVLWHYRDSNFEYWNIPKFETIMHLFIQCKWIISHYETP